MVDSWTAEERLRLVDKLSSCSSFTLMADRFLEPVASALRASSSVFLEFSERPGQGISIGKRSYVGTRPWSVDIYADGYFRADPLIGPCLRAFREASADETPSFGTLPAAASWRNSDYYQRFLRPSDIAHVLGIMVPHRSALGRQLLCLGFHRRDGDDPFGAAETRLLNQLTPLIRTVLASLAARDALPVSGALFEHFTRTNPRSGYLVFDEDLMLLQAGGGATEDLGIGATEPPGHVAPGCLLGELRQRLLATPPRVGVPPARYSLARPGGAATVEVEVQAVATESGPRLVATTSVAAGARAATDGCQRFGFTSRENEVARLVCGGNSNPEIGQTLGIALRTVENHLRSIYAKAQVSSRTQLAARLLL